MKKSEMIKKLTDYLHKQDYYVTTNKVQCEYLVELILNKAEKLGMTLKSVNPRLVGNYKNEQGFLNSGVHHTNHQDYGKDYFVYKWEDED